MRKRSLALASMVVLAAALWWSTATARPVCVVDEAEPALASPPTLQLAGGHIAVARVAPHGPWANCRLDGCIEATRAQATNTESGAGTRDGWRMSPTSTEIIEPARHTRAGRRSNTWDSLNDYSRAAWAATAAATTVARARTAAGMAGTAVATTHLHRPHRRKAARRLALVAWSAPNAVRRGCRVRAFAADVVGN